MECGNDLSDGVPLLSTEQAKDRASVLLTGSVLLPLFAASVVALEVQMDESASVWARNEIGEVTIAAPGPGGLPTSLAAVMMIGLVTGKDTSGASDVVL